MKDQEIADNCKENGIDTREGKEDIAGNAMAGAAPFTPCQSFAYSSCSLHPILAPLEGLLQRSSFKKGQQAVSLVDPMMPLSFQWDCSG